jgi:hypothetical protein
MAPVQSEALTLEALHAQIEQERQRRIAEHQQAIAALGIHQFALTAKPPGTRLNILAEGDSWFDYPFYHDTIDWIRDHGAPSPLILSLAHHGDAATEMLGVSKRQRIIDNMRNPANGVFDALLFSGGGNDIAGDQFCLWVTQHVAGTDPIHGVDHQRLSDMLGVIQAAYVDLIGIRDSINKNCIIFLHAYDFAQPTGLGVCNNTIGPWLQPSLNFRGWTQFAQAAAVVKEVLLGFDKLLVQIEQQHKNVVYVRTQNTLSPASDWDNELHPTVQGFNKIAGVFLRALRAKFAGRI